MTDFYKSVMITSVLNVICFRDSSRSKRRIPTSRNYINIQILSSLHIYISLKVYISGGTFDTVIRRSIEIEFDVFQIVLLIIKYPLLCRMIWLLLISSEWNVKNIFFLKTFFSVIRNLCEKSFIFRRIFLKICF